MQSNELDADNAPGKQLNRSIFQVIILGSGGGPDEDNVTGLLVRSIAKNWAKGSVLAVDAGVHLASIARILETEQGNVDYESGQEIHAKNGKHCKATYTHQGDHNISNESKKRVNVSMLDAFDGLKLPHKSARANAAYVTRELVSTYLITHPHLDHISGFVVNTASFQHTSRPKRLAALSTTIDAIKTHIFNDIIWPNMSDEDDGIGLVSYMRLAQGGNVALGNGNGRGYIEVCDGLAVRSWGVSHGHCMKRFNHRNSNAGLTNEMISQSSNYSPTQLSNPGVERDQNGRSHSFSMDRPCIYDSTAFFIRDEESGHEVLIFGDVEPDSISLSPRTAQVWAEAAPKVAQALLTGIFIECSYDDSQADETLFGHLAPRHLIVELKVLADKVTAVKTGAIVASTKKRKRMSNGLGGSPESTSRSRRSRSSHRASKGALSSSPTTDSTDDTPDHKMVESISLHPEQQPSASSASALTATAPSSSTTSKPLDGLTVFVIHVKNSLQDNISSGDSILAQLRAHEAKAGLGCNFIITQSGASITL